MSETKTTESRRHRITSGELTALRLLLRNVDSGIRAALTAENTADRKEALKIAQAQLNTALELTKDG